MSDRRNDDVWDHGRITIELVAPPDGREDRGDLPAEAEGPPRLRVRLIEAVALVRFEGAEILFEDAAVRAVRDQLHRLVEQGHTRLVVNLGGVRYLSSDVLSILAGLQKKLDPSGGRVQLCGLDPLVRDMVRIAQLDRLLDVCADEAEALGLLAC